MYRTCCEPIPARWVRVFLLESVRKIPQESACMAAATTDTTRLRKPSRSPSLMDTSEITSRAQAVMAASTLRVWVVSR